MQRPIVARITRCDRVATVPRSRAANRSIGTSLDGRRSSLRGIRIQVCWLPIFLFRAQGCARSFAYSLDVTGRNIPPLSEHTRWLYVGVIAVQKLAADPEILRQLQTVGFCVFNVS